MLLLRKLGRTGLKISAVSMGGIPVQRLTANEAAEVIETAFQAGINFIDTARGYTDSEFKFGEVLGRYKSSVIVATKSMARSAEDMAADIEKSLRDLKLEHIHLYQMHNVKDDDSLRKVLAPGGALEALKNAKRAGKISHIGITGHIPSVLVEAIKTGEFDTVQFPFNSVETSGLMELMPLAKKMDVGTIAMKPFAGGAIKSTVLSLRYILSQGFDTVIPGMDSCLQIQENVKAAGLGPLTPQEQETLQNEVSGLAGAFCRRCEYCQPCPQGVDIPTVFLLDGYWTRYGLKQWAVDRYKPMTVKASDCIDCGRCEEKCPYQLPIRDMLKKAVKNLEA